MRRRIAGLVAACALAACGDETGRSGGGADAAVRPPACVSSAECAAGLRCEGGRCVAPFDPPVGAADAGPDACAGSACPPAPWDAGAVDGGPPDARTDDAFAPPADARVSDAFVAPADARVPDAAIAPADAAAPDPDAAAPDPDAEVPDAARPDADLIPDKDAQPVDAARPDAAAPDPDAAAPDPDAAAPDPDAAAPDPDAALEPDAFVPPPTPPVGVYTYERLPIGGLTEARAVAFHPDGSYAVVLARTDVVHVIDWATNEARRYDLRPAGGALYWEDLVFDAAGERAILVGWQDVRGARTGVVHHLDDAAYRNGQDLPVAEVLQVDGHELAAIARPFEPAGRPVILSRSNRNGVATLREYDPDLPGFDGLVAARASGGVGCQDVAFAHDAFGNPSLVVVCGINGAVVLHYSEIDGFGEWAVNPGNNNLGNMARVASHPLGDYALIVSWSGRRILRFETGLLGRTQDAPHFATREIWGVTFQQEGQRALIYGGAAQIFDDPIDGTVFEYRHPLYHCDALDCDITPVHIPNFGAAPYNASANANLNDAAFRPGCDGGLIVGGESNIQGSRGQIIRFQIENGRDCD